MQLIRSLVMLSAFGIAANAWSYEVIVTEQQIQQNISSRMPLTRQGKIMSVTLDNTVIDLLGNGNRVRIQSDIALLSTIGLQSRGNLTAEGDVRFDDASDSFFIDNPQVLDLNIEGVPAVYKPSVIQLAQQTLAPAFSGQAVYVLRENGTQALARMMLRTMTIDGSQVVLDFSPF